MHTITMENTKIKRQNKDNFLFAISKYDTSLFKHEMNITIKYMCLNMCWSPTEILCMLVTAVLAVSKFVCECYVFCANQYNKDSLKNWRT